MIFKKLNPWPIGIIAVFALFFAGATAVILIASGARDHLVSEDYYERELKHQDRMDAELRAEKSGARVWQDPVAGTISVAIPPSHLQDSLSGEILFYRPDSARMDFKTALAPGADGVQVLEAQKLAPGPWRVQVRWMAGGLEHFMDRKILVKSGS